MSKGRGWVPEGIHIYWIGQKVHSHFSVTSLKNPNQFFDQPKLQSKCQSDQSTDFMCVCVSVSRSAVSDSLKTPWTVAHQAPLSIDFFQQETRECVCVLGGSGGSWPLDRCLPPYLPRYQHLKKSKLSFPKKEKNCSGLPFPSPGDLPDPGIKPSSLASPALAGSFFAIVPPVISYETTKSWESI